MRPAGREPRLAVYDERGTGGDGLNEVAEIEEVVEVLVLEKVNEGDDEKPEKSRDEEEVLGL
jgi:hypothetical protein